MQKNHKVKIVTSCYVESSDLIKWEIIFLDDNTEQIYVWPSVDLMTSLGIKQRVSKDLLHKFCADMQGKTINMYVDKEISTPEVNITEEEYKQLNTHVSQYFKDIKEIIDGE